MATKIKQKMNSGKNKYPSPKGDVLKKADATRERILAAARKVFARHSYHAASIRMIGAEGEFDHGIIRYHFASKAILFERVIKTICDEYYEGNVTWLNGLEKMPTLKGFSLYLDRFLDYNFKHPDAIRIFIQNIAQADKPELIPGYQHLPDLFARTRHTFEEKIRLRAPKDEISMFIDSFNSQIIYFIGANSCQALSLGMKPESAKYKKWVKDTLLYIYLPRLVKLIFPEEQED